MNEPKHQTVYRQARKMLCYVMLISKIKTEQFKLNMMQPLVQISPAKTRLVRNVDVNSLLHIMVPIIELQLKYNIPLLIL